MKAFVTNIFLSTAIILTTIKANAAELSLPGTPVEAVECFEVIKACDEALKAADELNENLTKSLEDSHKVIESQELHIKELIDAKNAWYREPLTVFLIGLTVGVVVHSAIR